LSLGILQQFNL